MVVHCPFVAQIKPKHSLSNLYYCVAAPCFSQLRCLLEFTFSEDWHERIVSVARQLPSDHFLSYTKLALLAGVAKTYCRAFPRILEGHPELPLDRILPATGAPCALPEWDGYEIFTSEDLFHNLRNHNHNGALPIT